MTQDQILALLRDALKYAGGFLVAKGYVSETTLMWEIGAALALGSTAWTQWTKRPDGLVASAAALPTVDLIKAPTIANSKTFADNPKVVAG